MIEINNQTRTKIDLKKVRQVAENFLEFYKQGDKEVSIAFIGDKRMRDLNRMYRRKDKVTDILSFCDDGQAILGEVVIDFQQIKRQAKQFSKSAKEELIFILVHGLLHLIGREDDTEKGRLEMIEEGERFLLANFF